ELHPDRDLSRSPLFQVMFLLQEAILGELRLPGLAVRPLPGQPAGARFDLLLQATEKEGELGFALEYSRDLFEPATAARLLSHFQNLLAELAAAPESPLDTRALLAPAERWEVLGEWNDTRAPLPGLAGVHAYFEAQADRTPEALAVEMDGSGLRLRGLRYRELEAAANRLAWHLRDLGVGPESAVGICLPRSLDLPVAVLAVLKAGGAYVPLDPSYPPERLAMMVEDGKLAALVTTSPFASRLPMFSGGHAGQAVVRLDADKGTIDLRSSARPRVPLAGGNLAYILFTSGSTGRPKGVAMPHRPLVNLVAWQLAASISTLGGRTLQFASLAFDVSFQEMFATWGSGGCLVLLAEETRRDPRALLRTLEERRVDRLFLPFVALQQLAEAVADVGGAPADLPPLREVITAGEQLQTTAALVELFGRLPGSRLDNHYGPTEAHAITAFTLVGPPASWPALPPIGRPIANLRILLLDRLTPVPGQPVPPGVPGELYVGGIAGAGLSRGYLGRPELTAERFLPDPWGSEPGGRLYKTGDLARWQPEGGLSYLGRADQQVKVRGFRVEPGEIEGVLAGHPEVRAAAVLALPGAGRGGTRLVAYVVAPRTRVAELREHLAARLPEHMVPALFVPLDALPLTPSGKIDRRGLAELPLERDAAEGRSPGAPGAPGALLTPTEERLAAIWREVLGTAEIGPEDSFFDLGGHSLLATRVTSRVRRVFGLELPLKRLFEAPTLGALARAIEEETAGGGGEVSATVGASGEPTTAAGPPLSFAQERLWFLDQLEPASPAYNMPAAFEIAGKFEIPVFAAALAEI
ncbi:MAG TPA: amino acid adenylation domain-containing protein, partial [Candidatus Dormibacteraeota bacterium]